MDMKRLLLTHLLAALAACSGAGPSDAGADAGLDAGPECTGVPARLTEYTCVETSLLTDVACRASLATTLSEHTADCDAGPGIVGYVSVNDCGALESVSWTYGFPGDTYECFYGRDGGAFTGGINYSDHGVLVTGQVGDCTALGAPSCRDGG